MCPGLETRASAEAPLNLPLSVSAVIAVLNFMVISKLRWSRLGKDKLHHPTHSPFSCAAQPYIPRACFCSSRDLCFHVTNSDNSPRSQSMASPHGSRTSQPSMFLRRPRDGMNRVPIVPPGLSLGAGTVPATIRPSWRCPKDEHG